jgi:Asp-tRNA(Asn)/Glu-tRNA(Gln) amidotransferase A subunit family amidase
MYAVPDVDEVVAVAKELGIHLGLEEAVLYRKYLIEQLRQFDAFVQARLEEPKPPMVSAAREPGYRPRPEEDPLNAWMWKCRIEGAAEGVLAGKTVSYNYTGHPALAVPVGKSSAGLPVSMQLVGRFFDDPLLMRVAHAYQHATDWDKIIGVHA